MEKKLSSKCIYRNGFWINYSKSQIFYKSTLILGIILLSIKWLSRALEKTDLAIARFAPFFKYIARVKNIEFFPNE